MEEENKETYLLSEVTAEDIATPQSTMSTTQTVSMVTMSAGAVSSQPESEPPGGQHGQTVYLAMGADGQALQILASGVLHAPPQQPEQTNSSQDGSTMDRVETTTTLASPLGGVALPPASIPGQIANPGFVTSSMAQSPILLVHGPVVSLPQGQAGQKIKKSPRRSPIAVQRGAGGSSKQTVRSLLQQTRTPALPAESDVAPNVTVLSRDPALSESLRLSAAGSGSSTPESSTSTKPTSLLSLLTQKVVHQKPGIEVQGVAVQDLDKILASQQASHQSKPSSKKPRILTTKQAMIAGPVTRTRMRSLIPILPAPQTSDINVINMPEPVFTAASQLPDSAEPLTKPGTLLSITPDVQLLGLEDTSHLIAQPGSLLPLQSELDASKHILSGSQVEFVQTVGDSSSVPSQEALLLAAEGPDLPENPTVEMDTMPHEDAAFTAPTGPSAFTPGETLTLVHVDPGDDLPVMCQEDKEQEMVEAALDSEPKIVQVTSAYDSTISRTEVIAEMVVEGPETQVDMVSDTHTAQAIIETVTTETVASSDPTQIDVTESPPNRIKAEKRQVCQVFGEMKAKVSQALIDALPGAKSLSLLNLAKDNNLYLTEEDNDTFTVSGNLHGLTAMHNVCLGLLGAATKCDHLEVKQPVSETCDKQVTCDLLKPQYSRSGRQLKWQTMDSRYDDIVITSYKEGKQKQAKPPKAQKSQRTRPSKKSKQRKREPDVLQKAVESLLSDGGPDHEGDDPAASVTTPLKALQQTLDIKVEEHGDDNDDADRLAASAAAEDNVMDTVKEEDIEKDSEKENEDGQTSEVTEDQKPQTAEDTGTVQILQSTEGLQLGTRKKHKKNYEKETPFKFFCKKCSFKTIRSSHYEKHLQYHNEEVPLLKCGKCDFTTIRRSHLTKHQQVHSQVRYKCPICKYKSDNKTLLTRHYRAKHKPESTRLRKELTLFSCPHCSYKTLRLYLYNRHLKCHSNVDESTEGYIHTYQCDICPYKTQRKEHYCRHKANVHEKKRPHLCDLCGKAFKRKDALKQHKLMHTDKNSRKYPYQCTEPGCHKGFSSKGHLKDHITIHTNVRAYLCEICGASFKTSSVQRKHVQTIHSNPRRFPCSKCEKRFNTKYSLRRHLSTHDTPGMRALEDTENVMLTETGEVTGVLEQLAQDDDIQKIHIIQPQQIIEVGSVIEQSVEGVMDAGQQVVIATTSEALAGVQTIEETYEQVVADGTEQSTLIHPNEASAALYYLTNFHSY